MSPEQAAGDLDRLGPQSDVYSLGATLYCIVTGQPPFAGEVGDVLRAVQEGDFPPPRAVNPSIARPLEVICLKAMALQPKDRYGSPKMLTEDVERWMADEPIGSLSRASAGAAGAVGPAHKPVVAGAAALLLTAVAALTVGIVLLGREQRKTDDQRLAAVQQRELVTEKAESLRRRDAVSRVDLAYREYLDDNVALADQLLDGCPVDLREWEWDYARRLGHSELKTFPGSSQGLDVWAVAFSPDGSLLACGSGPWSYVGTDPTGELIVRSVQTGAAVFALRGLKGAVQALAFSPDGHTLAAAWGFTGNPQGATLAVFDMPGGRKLWERPERGVQILSVAYSPDGRSIATGCGSFTEYAAIGFARLRDAATGEPIGPPITGGPGGVLCVAFSPDGRQLALASRDIADICDLSSPQRPIVHRPARARQLHLFGRFFAGRPQRGHRRLGQDHPALGPSTGAHLQTLIGHRGFVRSLAFSADGTQLISASEDKSVRCWDLAGGMENAAFHGHTGFVHCVAFGPDGALAASGSQDGTVKLWPAAAPDTQVTFRNSAGWVGTVALAPDGRRVASAHNGNIRIWDPRTGEELHRLTGPRSMTAHIALVFSPDGLTLAASGHGTSVNLWDTATWAPRHVLEGPNASPVNGRRFLARWQALRPTTGRGRNHPALGCLERDSRPDHSGAREGSERRGLRARRPPGRLRGRRPESQSLGCDNRRGARQLLGTLLWCARPGVLTRRPHDRVRRGRLSRTHSAEVKLWDSTSGQETASLVGHTSLVTAVAFFPGGRRLATASDDRTIKLWDTVTHEEVFTLRGHTSGVVSLAISRDGRLIVSGSIDYSAKTWSTANPMTQRRRRAFDSPRRRRASPVARSPRSCSSPTCSRPFGPKASSPRLRAAALESPSTAPRMPRDFTRPPGSLLYGRAASPTIIAWPCAGSRPLAGSSPTTPKGSPSTAGPRPGLLPSRSARTGDRDDP